MRGPRAQPPSGPEPERDDVELVPPFGEVYEPSATAQLVCLVRQEARDHWWGVAEATESSTELVVDAPPPDVPVALAAALPGDEVARLLRGHLPGGRQRGVRPGGQPVQLYSREPGVATGPLEGDPATDVLRVLGPDGRELLSILASHPVSAAD